MGLSYFGHSVLPPVKLQKSIPVVNRQYLFGSLNGFEVHNLTDLVIPIITGDRKPRDEIIDEGESSDDEVLEDRQSDHSSREASTELQQLFLDIEDIIDCLYKLSITIRNPAPHDHLVKAASVNTSFYETWDIQHLKSKFPCSKVSISDSPVSLMIYDT